MYRNEYNSDFTIFNVNRNKNVNAKDDTKLKPQFKDPKRESQTKPNVNNHKETLKRASKMIDGPELKGTINYMATAAAKTQRHAT